MRLVHDGEVPAHLSESGEYVISLCEVKGGDDLRLLKPLVDPELVPDVVPSQQEELLVELLLQLALPLEGKVRGTDDQDALRETSELQLADEQPRHDGLPCSRVVREEEPYPGRLEQVIVDRFKLMGERIHP